MKFTQKWKNFWQIQRHTTGGFTLVELIVVIAILAILAGIAVPAYSGYITKANQQADITLASEIENALLLAYYNGSLTAGDYVVVNYDGAASAGNSEDVAATTADAAMAAAFGTNWKDSLKLSYDNWEMGVVADSTAMGYVKNSSFNKDSLDDLLTSVQGITDQFNGVLESGKITIADDSDLANYLTEVGIDYANNTQAASNATVLYVGNTFANTDVTDDDFYRGWMNLDFNQITTDEYAAASGRYAAILALAQYIDGEKGTTYTDTLNAAEGTAVLTTASTVANQIVSTYPTEAYTYFGVDTTNGTYSTSSKGYADAMAFKAYMSGMSSATDSLVGNTDLNSSSYFTDGTVLSYVTNYISVGDILSTIGTDDAFVFVFDGENIVCAPLDY